MSSTCEVEPGAAPESVLVTTDSYSNFDLMSSSLEEIKHSNSINQDDSTTENSNNINTCDEEREPEEDSKSATLAKTKEEEDNISNTEWAVQKKHVFVLSSAGKPIYTRYGNEDKLAWLFGVMQTLVSFVQSNDDSIRSIHTGDVTFVFLVKKPLILVAVSRTGESVHQLVSQLTFVFNQIASILTLTKLTKIFEQRQNYDFRRLLLGVDRLIDHLLDYSEREPAFTLGAVQCLPLSSSMRNTISSGIVSSCNKIKNLVFAILLANNKLITLVRMKKYCIHPADLHLIVNLVEASESLKSAESWTPLCLPKFDASGFLYCHVSYLSEDCQACLLLLTVDREVFFTLSEAKQRIVEKLRRANCLEAINESLNTANETCPAAGFPELRHYLYKCKSTAQFYQPSLSAPYNKNTEHLMELYKRAYQRLHAPARPLKILFERNEDETLLAWDTKGFELYAVFEPVVDTVLAINTVGKLLNWIKKREEKLFHLNAPTF